MLHGCYRGSRAATAPVALSIAAHRGAWRSMVSAYVFISAAQRDLLGDLGLPPRRVFVRHNMIPRRDGQDRPRGPVVVYAGRLDEAKGLRVLMAGWDSYLARPGSGSLRLVIVGTGPLEPEIAGWAASRPSVELTGQVSGDQCAEIMAGARAVVVPSAWEETFGLVVVEAMAAGVPPIAAGHGSLPELITDGADGVLFAPGDPAALGAALAERRRQPRAVREVRRGCQGDLPAALRPRRQRRPAGGNIPVRDRQPREIARPYAFTYWPASVQN